MYELLQEGSVRDLTMEAVAKRARVGKPTPYKWWLTKAALVMATFNERIAEAHPPAAVGEKAEERIRNAAVALIRSYRGPLGKISAELIAEGQSEPDIVRQWYDGHIRSRRAANAADIERGIASGELAPGTDPDLVLDANFGAIYYRLLFRSTPLTEQFGRELVRQVFRGIRADR